MTQSTDHSLPVANSPTANQPEPETDNSPPSNAEVKEKRNYNLSSIYAFMSYKKTP
jgi:hypothetical protein